MKTCESVSYQSHIKYRHIMSLCFSRENTISCSIKQLTKCWTFWSWSKKPWSTCFILSMLWLYSVQQNWALLQSQQHNQHPLRVGTFFLSIIQKKKIKENFYTKWKQRKVTFFRFQMKIFSFIEIATLRNEVSLFENIRNNLVNFKKTLNSK